MRVANCCMFSGEARAACVFCSSTEKQTIASGSRQSPATTSRGHQVLNAELEAQKQLVVELARRADQLDWIHC